VLDSPTRLLAASARLARDVRRLDGIGVYCFNHIDPLLAYAPHNGYRSQQAGRVIDQEQKGCQ